MKTRSPWAKKVHGSAGAFGGGRSGDTESAAPRGRGSRGSSSGIADAETNGFSGGGPGRGGSRGGDESGGAGIAAPVQEGPEVVIRWESAVPVLEATKFKLPPQLDDHYAVSITGLPPQLLIIAVSGGGEAGADPAAETRARQNRLLRAATLTAKKRDPQTADVVFQTSDKRTLIFGFQKASFPLAPADKDIEVILKFGATIFKAKFEPKEMIYKGGLTV